MRCASALAWALVLVFAAGPVAVPAWIRDQGQAGSVQDRGGRGTGVRQRQSIPRDAPAVAPATAGTSIVSGTVMVAGTGSPARRARVMLNGLDGGGSRTTAADEDGRFAFSGVASGRYSLSASKPGHVGATYGQTQPGRPGTPIQLGERQTFSTTLHLARGSVITGTVLDEHAEPAPGIQVRVLRYVMQGGRRTLQQSGAGSTDDRGVYRIYGLQPGNYIVSAVPRNAGPAVDVARMREELETVRERLVAMAASDAMAQELSARANLLQAEIPRHDEQATGYAPVYYPGTAAATEATALTLGIAEERTSVDFQLQRVPMAIVDGVVVNSTGHAVQNVQLTLVNAAHTAPGVGTISSRADAEGRFRLANVPPGNYRLVARANAPRGGRGGPSGLPAGRGGRGNQPPPVRLWGTVDLPVDGRSLTNVVVPLQQGLTVAGRIQFNGMTRQPPADLSLMRVNLVPADGAGPGGLAQAAAGTVDAAGRFTIPSVVPGLYRLTASGAGSGWILEGSLVDGQDTLDFPVEVKPAAAINSAVVTFTDREAQLSGAITTAQGQPAPGHTLILYSADERFWGPQSRRIRSTRPATDGRFSFAGFPPGEYKLVALADVEPGSWFDPVFLQQMEGAAISIALAEGERKVQNIQVASSSR